jgi:hypothetical protein
MSWYDNDTEIKNEGTRSNNYGNNEQNLHQTEALVAMIYLVWPIEVVKFRSHTYVKLRKGIHRIRDHTMYS